MANKELMELRVKLLELARNEILCQNTFRDKNGKYKDDDVSTMLYRQSSGRCEAYMNVIDLLKNYEEE